jgi:MoxR-like ATPase
LIDEIDKGESDVPNGLLEALGEGILRPPGLERAVQFDGGAPPFVLITTNEERALPNAFVRRCLVLRLDLPRLNQLPIPGERQGPDEAQSLAERKAFIDFLVARGRAHFGPKASAPNERFELPELSLAEREVLEAAAGLLLEDRLAALAQELPPPGLAEFLDLVRAVRALARDPSEQKKLVLGLRKFAFQKHQSGEPRANPSAGGS